MTNLERIKNMNAEELAKVIFHINSYCCKVCKFKRKGKRCMGSDCRATIKLWLESEVSE